MDFLSALNFGSEYQKVFESAVNKTKEGISIADASLQGMPLVFVNRGFCEMTGYQPTEIMGKNCRFLQGPDTSEEAITTLRNAIDAKENCSVRLLNYRKDGVPFWNQLSLVPIFNTDKELTHYVGIQLDVTAEVKAEKEKQQYQAMKATMETVNGIVFNHLFFLKFFREKIEAPDGDREALLAEFDQRWDSVHQKLDQLSKAKGYREVEILNQIKAIPMNPDGTEVNES